MAYYQDIFLSLPQISNPLNNPHVKILETNKPPGG